MKKPSPKEKRIWCIRAGQKGAAHNLFLEHSLIVLSRQGFGDLRLLPKEREAFYAVYSKRHLDEGGTAIRAIGGKFFRFIHEIQNDDLVLYPCLLDKEVHYGVVAESYSFDKADKDFPHRRKMIWEGAFAKSILSETARRELGAARTLFRLKSHVDEIWEVICRLRPVSPEAGGEKLKKAKK